MKDKAIHYSNIKRYVSNSVGDIPRVVKRTPAHGIVSKVQFCFINFYNVSGDFS